MTASRQPVQKVEKKLADQWRPHTARREAHSSMPATRTTPRVGCVPALLQAAQDRGVAHWHAEPGHQSLGGAATDAVAKQPDDPGQPGGPACEWARKRRKPFGENPAFALIVPTSPAAQPHPDIHRPSSSRKITQRPYTEAVMGTRFYAADRRRGRAPVPCHERRPRRSNPDLPARRR
jgi:hypothetical protein